MIVAVVAVVVVVVLLPWALVAEHCMSLNYSLFHTRPPSTLFQLTPPQNLVMTTYISIALPSLNDGSPVAFLSDVSNNFSYCRLKYGYGECYCILSGHLCNRLSSLHEYSDASLPETC